MWDACRKIYRSDTRVSVLRFVLALQQSAPIYFLYSSMNSNVFSLLQSAISML